ncbi:Enoyl-CoA hydratase/carnithine racemase [Epibacterium ulvae]|uniref:Enoyl-CoA hydratase/carnithine racemase n=1 Tax=Epibacterium ulvae TaxID=1156985 RepID=A0A1G5R895_9RHOB|nr:enoyl-CoA hydratase/isomerase family protein [Epibacterium ulvae]SCZ70303.1 Enoyl-CoA hydratase/carnithine racemase [Epibacterium ulvae]
MIHVQKSETDIWTVVLDRPEKANALTAEMLESMIKTMHEAKAARGLILTGAGKVFSAGADLDAAHNGLAISPLWEELSSAVAALPCLTIAALNGAMAGGANGMALACDLRIAAHEVKIFYPVMKLGFLPQPSDVKRLKALIGPARTKMILAAGQKIPAAEALSWGLVDRIVPPEQLIDTAHDLLHDASHARPELAHEILQVCR